MADSILILWIPSKALINASLSVQLTHSHPLHTLPFPSSAKNFVPGKEAQSTRVALSVLRVQEQLPRARVVYCSATGDAWGGVYALDPVPLGHPQISVLLLTPPFPPFPYQA